MQPHKAICPHCGSDKAMRRGSYPKQRYQCQNCYRYYREERTTPKVLLFDIETLPMKVYVWGLYKQRISPDNIITDWCMLSYAAKWLFEPTVMGEVLTPEEVLLREDKRILRGLWDLMDKADIIISHNGNSFDIPRTNARFVANGMCPPSYYQSIDTLAQSSKLYMSSKKLDELAKKFRLKTKIKTEFDLWTRCDAGNEKALKDMLEYNKQDVLVLEDVYDVLRPWLTGHPNLSLYVSTEEDTTCPRCGNESLRWEGHYATSASMYRAFRCNHCGAIGRAKARSSTSKLRNV